MLICCSKCFEIILLSAFEPVMQYFLPDSVYFVFMTDSFLSNLLLEL